MNFVERKQKISRISGCDELPVKSSKRICPRNEIASQSSKRKSTEFHEADKNAEQRTNSNVNYDRVIKATKKKSKRFGKGFQTSEPDFYHSKTMSERKLKADIDCCIIFDSTANKSSEIGEAACLPETTRELQKASLAVQTDESHVLKQRSNSLNSDEAFKIDEDCSVIFDSSLEGSGAKLNLCSVNVSVSNSFEVTESAFSTITQTAFDRQARQIWSLREMTMCDLDMDEVELDFEPSLVHQLFNHSKNISKAQRTELMSQGICLRTGKWSKQEDKILLRNWYDFVEKYEIDNPVLLLGLYNRLHSRKVRCFVRAKKMFFHLGKGLNDRSLNSIYRRARKILDMWNYKGRLSEEEKENLIALHKKFGNQWARIAVILNRTAQACLSAYYYFGKEYRRGKWTTEEDAMLLKAVRRHVGKKQLLQKFRGFPWRKIARHVPGRYAHVCRLRWLHSLCWKPRLMDRPKWKKTDSALLIYLMYSNIVEEECFIDWDLMYERFKTSVSSYSALRAHWRQLKSKVPDAADKDHESIVMYLYRNCLPKIMEECNISESDLESVMK